MATKLNIPYERRSHDPELEQRYRSQAPKPVPHGKFRSLGLGIITGAADDDPSAIGTYALIGWIVGMCAEVLLPGAAPRSLIGTTLVGVGGAIFGALVGGQLGWWHRGQVPGFILSLLGAILLLVIYRVARRKARDETKN